VDADLELAEEKAKDLGVDLFSSDLRQALDRTEMDAVCITTPTFTHADIAIEAARAGKHIFCEKPMALSLDETDRMIQAAEEAGVKLQIGFMRRFDPPFVTAKERIEGGEIGRPMVIRSLTRGPGLPPRWACDPRTSNGMLAEVNSHDFDTIRWLADAEFERIWAEANALKCFDLKEEFPNFYDNAIVSLRLENGTLGIIEGGCPVDYGYDARAEVLGSEGVILVGELQDRAVTTCTKQAGVVTSNFRSWRNRFRDAYIAEARHFVECILQDRDPLVTGHDGRKAVEAVLAANESIRSGRPVSLL
jgi:predicted dehydrogenase